MASKFYAVQKGKIPGIYYSWDECKKMVDGFPGAVYKSFKTLEEAEAFVGAEGTSRKRSEKAEKPDTGKQEQNPTVYAFVDGSYNIATKVYGYGGFLIHNGEKEVLQGSGKDAEMASMRNVSGEILGAMAAVERAIELKLPEVTIYYDYMGIEGVLPDAICYRLQQRYMMPDLKAGDYSAGMLKGVMAVTKYLMSSDYERAGMTGNRSPSSSDDDFMWIFVVGIIGMIGFSAFIAYLKYRPKACPRCGKKTFVYMGQQVIREATRFSEGLAEDVYRCKSCGYTEKKNRTIDRIHRGGGGPIIMGGGGGFGGFSGGGGGGSWGGGSSGGGGSISRF